METARDVYSPSVRRVLELPRPVWRGRMHLWAIPVAIIAGIAIVVVADSALARFTAVLYGLGTVGLYLVSAAAHYKIWEPARLHMLFQLDHSMIMLFIVASTAPIALVAMGGGWGTVLFSGMVIAVLLGLMMVWLPFHPPRGFMNALFISIGWWPVLFVVLLARSLGAGGMALLLGGGLIFTVGAVIVGSQRPDPNPRVFGYHEIWHVLVILGNAVHFALMWVIVTGGTPI
ncbi:MAG: PAQR family membrane homeostasis protein TrhA [Acidimicrobiales bacterium]